MQHKATRALFMAVVALCSFTACDDSDFVLTDEASTPYEADIRYIVLDDPSIMKQPQDSIKVVNDNPQVRVTFGEYLEHLAPKFVLTKGASIFMPDKNGDWTVEANGVARNFNGKSQKYMVVSANRKSHHIYELTFTSKAMATEYHFEYYKVTDKAPFFYEWFDNEDFAINTWTTANGGFAMAKQTAKKEDYPSTPCEGVNGGMGIKLVTSETGKFGAQMGMPLAAGNLFIGTFESKTALKKPLESTKFGMPFDRKPIVLSGWMNYVPGEKYQDPDKVIHEDMADTCAIYAVLYRNADTDGNAVILDGTNIDSSPYIVAKAEVSTDLTVGTKGEWVEFTAWFDYEKYGNKLDLDLLKANGYNLTIVCSSSSQGAYFSGAVGSTLKVDEIKLLCDEE